MLQTLVPIPLCHWPVAGVGKGVAKLLVNIHGETGAVKAAGGSAAIDIAGAQVLAWAVSTILLPLEEPSELVRSRKSLRM